MARYALVRLRKPRSVIVDGNGDLLVSSSIETLLECRARVNGGRQFNVYQLVRVPKANLPSRR